MAAAFAAAKYPPIAVNIGLGGGGVSSALLHPVRILTIFEIVGEERGWGPTGLGIFNGDGGDGEEGNIVYGVGRGRGEVASVVGEGDMGFGESGREGEVGVGGDGGEGELGLGEGQGEGIVDLGEGKREGEVGFEGGKGWEM